MEEEQGSRFFCLQRGSLLVWALVYLWKLLSDCFSITCFISSFFSPFKLSLSPIKVLLDKFSHFYFFMFSLLVEVGTGGREQLCGWYSGSTHIPNHLAPCKGQSLSCLCSIWKVERWKEMEAYFVSWEVRMDPELQLLVVPSQPFNLFPSFWERLQHILMFGAGVLDYNLFRWMPCYLWFWKKKCRCFTQV